MTTKTYYCTPDEVRIQLGITSSVLSDADANVLIQFAQSEIDVLTHTQFLKVQVDSTATAGASTTITDSTAGWTIDEWNADENLVGGYMVYIYTGTGSGQCKTIIDSTATVLTVDSAWDTNPDSTSKFRILKNTYTNETFTGDDTNIYYSGLYPIFNLRSMTLDSTSVTLSSVYQTPALGKLQLGTTSEKTLFSETTPLLNNIKYFFGVSPVPDIISAYCAVQAAIYAGQYMIGSTYTIATSYSHPDISVTKGVPYPHFDRALSAIQKKADMYKTIILNSLMRYHFG